MWRITLVMRKVEDELFSWPGGETNYDNWIEYAAFFHSTGRQERCFDCYERAVEIDATERNAYVYIAAIYHDLNRPADCKKVLEEALRRATPHPEIHTYMAVALREEGDVSGAVGHLQTAISLDNTNPKTWLELASCYRQLGRNVKAWWCLGKAKRLDSAISVVPEVPESP